MRTEKHPSKTREAQDIAPVEKDPESLWFDASVSPEALRRLDPLEITSEMVERAEQPELSDYWLVSLPPRAFTLRQEFLESKVRRESCGNRESPAEFLRRIRGSV